VSQLALAHERHLLARGCTIRLSVQNAKDHQNLTKSHTDNISTDDRIPVIKLQIVKKHKNKEEFIDLNLDNISKVFSE
jgi:hypothetical protein